MIAKESFGVFEATALNEIHEALPVVRETRNMFLCLYAKTFRDYAERKDYRVGIEEFKKFVLNCLEESGLATRQEVV